MKRLLPILALLLAATAPICAAQAAPPITTSQITFPNAQNPQPVQQATINVIGQPGGQIYYVWIVADYTIGNATPSPGFMVRNAPAVLTSSNYLSVSWFPAQGAATYDVLLTTTPATPSGSCGCAVAAGVAGTTYQIKTNTLGAYTVNTWSGSTWFTVSNPPISSGLSGLTFANPNGVQMVVRSDAGGDLYSTWTSHGVLNGQNIEQVRYADQFSGATVPGKLDACSASLAGANGICWVPTGLGSGVSASPPNGVDFFDVRGTQSVIGNTSAYIPIFLSDAYAGSGATNRIFNSAFQVHAAAGGTLSTPGAAEAVGLFSAAERTGGDRPIWAFNTVTQYADHNNYATGAELDLNNNGTDATDGQSNQENGLLVLSGGSNRPLYGISVGSSTAGDTWQEAALFQKFHTFGASITAGDSGSIALHIVPPDNTSALEVDGRNAANSADAWSITNSGNISASLFNCTGCDYQVNGTTVINASGEGLFNSLSINGGTAITGQTGTGGTAVMSASPTVASPTLTGAPKLPTYTVATLPSASTSGVGATVVVTDATTFTIGACVGGGTDVVLAVSTGSAWNCM